MNTDIEFLSGLKADLLAAANRSVEARELRLAVGTGGTGRGGPPRIRVRVVAAATLAFLTLAGVVGYLATKHGGDGTSRQELAARGFVNGVGTGTGTPAKRADLHGFAPVVPGPRPAENTNLAGIFGLSGSEAPDSAQRVHVAAPQTGAIPPPAAPELSPNGVPRIGPAIIKTAELEIKVAKDTFGRQFAKVSYIAEKYGGFVQTSSTQGEQTKSGSVLIRVPADRFEAAVNDLIALGTIESKSVKGQDVTAQFVDLGARLRNAQHEEAVLLKLLDRAPTVQATLSVEGQVSNVELQIEELQGELRVLTNRADYGTILVNLYEQKPKPKPKPKPHHPGHTSFATAWHHSIDGFYGVATSVVIGLGYLIPIAALLLVAWVLFRRIYRSRVPA